MVTVFLERDLLSPTATAEKRDKKGEECSADYEEKGAMGLRHGVGDGERWDRVRLGGFVGVKLTVRAARGFIAENKPTKIVRWGGDPRLHIVEHACPAPDEVSQSGCHIGAGAGRSGEFSARSGPGRPLIVKSTEPGGIASFGENSRATSSASPCIGKGILPP